MATRTIFVVCLFAVLLGCGWSDSDYCCTETPAGCVEVACPSDPPAPKASVTPPSPGSR